METCAVIDQISSTFIFYYFSFCQLFFIVLLFIIFIIIYFYGKYSYNIYAYTEIWKIAIYQTVYLGTGRKVLV